MNYVVTNAQMKLAEQNCNSTHISYEKMMENAGNACASEIMKLVPKSGQIVIICGSGNNGGDGFVIAKRLFSEGFSPVVILANGEPKTDCAKYHYDLLNGVEILDFNNDKKNCIKTITESLSVVDCIFGTGFHGALPDYASELICAANCCKIRIAVDVPSGVNSDTCEADKGCFKPTHTLFLAAIKAGMLSLPCFDNLGETTLLDIGIPSNSYTEFVAKITDDSFRRPFPKRSKSAHKGTNGKLLNIAGCLNYNGAAAMSTMSALRSGVGLCALATPRSVINIAASKLNEATYIPLPETEDGFAKGSSVDTILHSFDRVTTILVGCGMGNRKSTRKIVEAVVRNASCPIIIDADGINSISENIDILKERKSEIIITPHVMEFSRINGMPVPDIQRDRINAAKRFSEKYGVITVLKGCNTVIASPDGTCYVNTCGNVGLAKGGSGDVLAGIIGAMAAQGIAPLTAAVSGVYCHARAADMLLQELPTEAILPTDIINALPKVYRS